MANDQVITTTTRVPLPLYQQLRKRVSADLSINSQIIAAIEAYLKAQSVEQKAP